VSTGTLDPAGTPAPPRGGWRHELRPLLLRVHFYAGVFVAPFLLVAATTGLLYTVTPEVEQLVHHQELTARAAPGATPLPLDRQVDAALAGQPVGTVGEIRPSPTPGGTTRVSFDHVPGVRADHEWTVFVDPYTARVRGALPTFGEWLPVRDWFDELHRTLHLGPVGEVYSEVAASWLWVLTLSGLALWLARRRGRVLLPARGRTGRARLLSWHATPGVWLAAGLLFLSATGLTWSQFAGANVTQVRHLFAWSTPSVQATAPVSPSAGVAVDARRALDVARAHGLSDPVALTPPSRPGQAWTVQQVQRSWPEKQDAMAVDPGTGAVLDTVRFADWPLAAKLARWGVDAHMGLLFGLANRIVLAAVAITLITMILLGYRMWWRRRPPGRVGARPSVPGRRPGFAVVASTAAAAVLVGIALPVFGATLLLFVLIAAWRTPTPAL
jgi:uncharacterized iron-regulated membrane protein